MTSAPSVRPVGLYLAGVGLVGRALLEQVAGLPGAPLRLVGACTRRTSAWSEGGLDPAAPALDAAPPDWPAVLDRLARLGRRAVFVDATGCPDVGRRYAQLLAAGVHVVTPSKRANTFEQPYFDLLGAVRARSGASYRYEATVGAGLPVVRVVEDLVATGDRVRQIEGVLSGTLGYLFSRVEAGQPFSEALAEAAAAGYTEPDPRDDLSGEDVARKLVILARTAGIRVERADIHVETLTPPDVQGVPAHGVVAALKAHDAAWAQRAAEAARDGRRLRYVARLDEAGLRVGVEAVPVESPLGRLTGTDNLVRLWTDRYAHSPIAVQGPGAGPAVTAAGVLADVLDVARPLLRAPERRWRPRRGATASPFRITRRR